MSAFSNGACGSPGGGFTIAVTKAGTGTGTVTSSPAGISCGTTCSSTYSTNTSVTLTALPSSGSAFSGWSGSCGGTDTCTLVGNVSMSATATFAAAGAVAVSSVSPNQGAPGTAVPVTINGSGFAAGAAVSVSGMGVTGGGVTVGSATQLTATLTIGSGAALGARDVTVTNSGGGTGTISGGFTVANPPSPTPVLSGISPSTVSAGAAAFTLTASGASFVAGSVIQVNGATRATTFVSTTQLTATFPASDIVSPGALVITVFTPAPGGGTSATRTLTVTGPSLTVSATSSLPGGSITATLSNSPGGGTDWLALAQVGAADTSYLQWIYVGAGTTSRAWTVPMPATVGSYEFRLYLDNSYTVAARSPAVSVANISPTPAIGSLSPASIAGGSGAFALTVTGTGFVSGATATVGGQARMVTFVSATGLSLAILATDITSPGAVPVQVVNPAACVGGLCSSNTVNLIVTAPPPAPGLASISPATVGAGGAAFTLTANGSSFAGNSVVQVNGAARATTFVSANQLTAVIPASDIASTGSFAITVFTPAPGGGISGTQILTVTGPSLAVSVTTSPPGGSVTATLSNAPGGSTDWLALAQVGTPDISYVQWAYVGAGVTSRPWVVTMPATVGSYEVRLYLNNSYTVAARSPAVAVANISPTPAISSLSPAGITAGSGAFSLTVTGSGFVSGATALVGGQARTMTFVSDTQVAVAVTAPDVATQGTIGVQIVNPSSCVSGLCASNSAGLAVTAPPPAPTLTSMSPTTVAMGSSAFTLTAIGAGFTSSSVIQVNGVTRATTFVAPTQLAATIPASDVAVAGVLGITVVTPAPGGGASSVQILTVKGPSLSVGATVATPGGSITAILSTSPGGSTDWLALAEVGAPDTSYLQWQYVGAGVTNRTWTVTMPATAGAYEFRLYLNNSYTVAAKSPAVSVADTTP